MTVLCSGWVSPPPPSAFWSFLDSSLIVSGRAVQMDPSTAPEFADNAGGIVVGQVTVLPTAPAPARCVTMSAQGRSHGQEEDWEELLFRFSLGAGGCGAAAPPPPPPLPPQHHQKPPPPPPPPVSANIGCDGVVVQPGYHVAYRQAPSPPCGPGLHCRTYPEASVAMVTCTPPYQLTKHDDTGPKVLSFAEVQCLHGQWSALPARCELPAPIAPTRPPPPAPPRPVVRPPVNPNAVCTMDSLATRIGEVNDICCLRAGFECADGAPQTCSTACRDVVLDLWSGCQSVLQQMPPGFSALDDFVSVCSTGNGGAAGGAAGALDSLKNPDGPALAGSSHMQFTCTYSELTGIALQCSTADPSSVATFCASRCASQLVPWAAQCASTMQFALDALGLAETFNSLIDQCNPATDDAHVCPMEQITTACKSFSHLGATSEAMCATPCVETVVAHYDACRASTDPRVVTEFSANSWRTVVETCQSLHDSSGVVGNEIAAQCALIQEPMSAQLNSLCCGGADCSTTPAFCPTACSDSLLPYFRDCASQLVTDDPPLFARLTQLATTCTRQNGRGGHR